MKSNVASRNGHLLYLGTGERNVVPVQTEYNVWEDISDQKIEKRKEGNYRQMIKS